MAVKGLNGGHNKQRILTMLTCQLLTNEADVLVLAILKPIQLQGLRMPQKAFETATILMLA